MQEVVLIPGDGVGPELIDATKQCVDATGAKINWITKNAGTSTLESEKSLLPDHVLAEIQRTGLALKGPIITPVGTGFRSVNVALRQTLDLYACVRPCRSILGIPSPFGAEKKIDITIIRENTEDLYAGVEFESGKSETKELIQFMQDRNPKKIAPSAGISIKAITEEASRKIAQFACDFARKNKRKKVSIVSKSNIMKYSDGLFMDSAKEVISSYTDLECEHVLVDALCMKLVQDPEQFDILLLPNLYGDIVSDLCAGLVGGLGVAPGSNIGKEAVIYEATHGAAPEFAGKNVLNPTALLLCAIMLLKDIGQEESGQRLESALLSVLEKGEIRTIDLLSPEEKHKSVSTQRFTEELIKNL